MASVRKNGYTYQEICKVLGNNKIVYEYIKWKSGYRNLWERVTREEYMNAKLKK